MLAFVWLFFEDKVSASPASLEFTNVYWAGLRLTDLSPCFCLLSVGIKDTCHHAQQFGVLYDGKKDGHMAGEVDKWYTRVMTKMFNVVLTAEFG